MTPRPTVACHKTGRTDHGGKAPGCCRRVFGRGVGPAIAVVPFFLFILLILALSARQAGAYDFGLSVRTVGQGYQERRYGSSGASELLSRRRLTQFLNLSVFNIVPEAWRGRDGDRNSVSFELGMRFDSDFGQFLLGRPRGMDTIAELSQNQIDVLYGYLLARDIAGRVDLQLGRQLHYDLVDFYSFDGADLQLRAGRFVTAQAFGGTEVRGQMPLSAPLYEIDGTSVGSRDPATRPQQGEGLRPMFGGAVALDRGSPVDARVAYRRVLSPTVSAAPGEPTSGINHESVSMTADARWRDRVFLVGGARYNLLVAAWDDQQVGVRWRVGTRHLVSAEYSYLAPTFDGDSIWNVFGAGAYRDLRAAYDIELSTVWRAHVRGFLRTFVDPPGTAADTRALGDAAEGGRQAYGGNAGADGRGPRGRARLDVYAEGGTGGWKVGGDLVGRFTVRPNVLDVEGRVTAYAWRADGVPEPRNSIMVGTAVGTLYRMSRNMRLHLLGENNTGTYYRVQLRALAMLEVDVTL